MSNNVLMMALVAMIVAWMAGAGRMGTTSSFGGARVALVGSGSNGTGGGLGNNLEEIRTVVSGGGGLGGQEGGWGGGRGEAEGETSSLCEHSGTGVQNFLAGKFSPAHGLWQISEIWPFSKKFAAWANVADVGAGVAGSVALGGHLGRAGGILAGLLVSLPFPLSTGHSLPLFRPLSALIIIGVLGLESVGAAKITAGNLMSCAIINDQVGCWGLGDNGATGRGNTNNWGDQPGEMANLVPIPLPSPTLKVDQVVTSIGFGFVGDHTCLLFSNKQVCFILMDQIFFSIMNGNLGCVFWL
jgi:hypothetical protein